MDSQSEKLFKRDKNIEERFEAEMSSRKNSDKEEITKIITDEEIIDFFVEKGVYKSISSLDSSFKTNPDLRLNHISDEEMKYTFMHPEKNSTMTLATTLALYAWHSEHHLNHILQLRKRMKW